MCRSFAAFQGKLSEATLERQVECHKGQKIVRTQHIYTLRVSLLVQHPLPCFCLSTQIRSRRSFLPHQHPLFCPSHDSTGLSYPLRRCTRTLQHLSRHQPRTETVLVRYRSIGQPLATMSTPGGPPSDAEMRDAEQRTPLAPASLANRSAAGASSPLAFPSSSPLKSQASSVRQPQSSLGGKSLMHR